MFQEKLPNSGFHLILLRGSQLMPDFISNFIRVAQSILEKLERSIKIARPLAGREKFMPNKGGGNVEKKQSNCTDIMRGTLARIEKL